MSTAAQAGAKQMLGAEIVQLGEMVNYQDGAVVSRTLVKRATGTITAFAFDAGQGLSEHTAQFDALAQSWRARRRSRSLGSHFLCAAGKPSCCQLGSPTRWRRRRSSRCC